MGRNHKRSKKEELEARGYKPIREIAKIAEVEKSTIHYYAKLGLIPKPVKVSKQMAYYPPETVENVKIIKHLQKRYLPLKEIKRILKNSSNISEVLERVDKGILNGSSTERSADLKINLPAGVIEKLKKIGLIKTGKNSIEQEILQVIEKMNRAGLNESNGFHISFLKNYVDVCKKLVELEFSEFNSRVMGKLPPEKIIELAKSGIEETSELIKLTHKRLLLEKLKELSSEIKVRSEYK